MEKRILAMGNKFEDARADVVVLSDAISHQRNLLDATRSDLQRERHEHGLGLRSKINQIFSEVKSLEQTKMLRERQIDKSRMEINELKQQQKNLQGMIEKAREVQLGISDRLDEAKAKAKLYKRAFTEEKEAAKVKTQTRSQMQEETTGLIASCNDKIASLTDEIRLASEASLRLQRELGNTANQTK